MCEQYFLHRHIRFYHRKNSEPDTRSSEESSKTTLTDYK